MWTPLIGRGLISATAARTAFALAWAAHLTIPAAVLSHLTAALLLGLPVPEPDGAHVYADDHHRTPGIRIHRVPLSAADRWHRHGLPVTSRLRTVLDSLSVLDQPDARRLWAFAASRGILTVPQLAHAVRDRFDWPGTPNLLSLLAFARDGATSEAERLLIGVLRRASIRGWQTGATIRDGSGFIIGRPDILFPAARLIIEMDGYSAHSGMHAFVADRRRQNAFVNAGYRVLRVTWPDLMQRPDAIVAEIRAALEQTLPS